MPTNVPSAGERPTIITKPNQRFATTALSTKYRKYAVNGELLKDDTTGELFYKRLDDGKVISFHQNKKYFHDLALELRVLLNNNQNFLYPIEDEAAFLVSSNYDLVAINHEELLNIYTNDQTINNTDTDLLYQFRFRLSAKTNGFFCRISTRDVDKPAVEYITNYYNTVIKNYTGKNPQCALERTKFTQMKWEDSNATLHYRVAITGDDKSLTYNCTDYVRLNESCMVDLPYLDILQDFPNGYKEAEVMIDSVTYDKLHFMLQRESLFGETFTNGLKKYLFQTGRIESHIINIMGFIDKPEDYMVLGNDTILAFMDLPYLNRYMGKMLSIFEEGDFITSIPRPNPQNWVPNGVWAEMVRYIDTNGTVTNTGSENSDRVQELEDMFGPGRVQHANLTMEPTDHDDILLDNIEEQIWYDAVTHTNLTTNPVEYENMLLADSEDQRWEV